MQNAANDKDIENISAHFAIAVSFVEPASDVCSRPIDKLFNKQSHIPEGHLSALIFL